MKKLLKKKLSKKQKRILKKGLMVLVPAFLIVIASFIGAYTLFHKYHTESFMVDNYEFIVSAYSIKDKPVASLYTTSFKSKDTDEVFYVDFLGVLKKDKVTDFDDEPLIVGGNDYLYKIDSSVKCGQDLLLYYEVSGDELLEIRIRGEEMNGVDGEKGKCHAIVTDKTLESKKLRRILDITINDYE